MIYYTSAFLLGLLGSFHCAGMCGPIALALPLDQSSRIKIVAGRMMYNGGRILTYMMLGVIAGLIGHGIAYAGFQKTLSISAGLLMLLIAASSLYFSHVKITNPFLNKISAILRAPFKKLFRKHSPGAMLGIGLLNGILPCGFVYMATVASAASGNWLQSIGYMMSFGLGTVPMMLSLSLTGNMVGIKFNRYVRKATPYVAMIVAVFLIARGFMPVHSCHH